MTRVIDPLRDARRPLHEGLRTIQVAANAVGTAEEPIARAAIEAALEYLTEEFLPTSRAEEFTIFIAMDGVYGTTDSCEVMKAQHASIAAMVDDLERVAKAAEADGDAAAYARYLHPLLHGLYALCRAHLESEDDVYLPLLDESLSESQVGVLVDNLGRIAAGSAAPA